MTCITYLNILLLYNKVQISSLLYRSNNSITRPDTRRTPMPIDMACSSSLATSNLRRVTTDLPAADLSPKVTKSPSARMVLMALKTHSRLSLISTLKGTRKSKQNAPPKRCISSSTITTSACTLGTVTRKPTT